MNESTIKANQVSSNEAPGVALAAILGDDLCSAKGALIEMTRRNRELLDGGDAAIADSLGRQAVVLEALFYKLIETAAKTKQNDVTSAALKAAMGAQKSLLATLGAIMQINRSNA